MPCFSARDRSRPASASPSAEDPAHLRRDVGEISVLAARAARRLLAHVRRDRAILLLEVRLRHALDVRGVTASRFAGASLISSHVPRASAIASWMSRKKLLPSRRN
jgi:hypothetical protein